MTELTFDILSKAWNKVKTERTATLKNHVPGLSDPTPIFVKRVMDDPHGMVVEFKGLEKAVLNPTRDIPMLKKVILNWIRSFASASQIVRGEANSLIIRIDKAVNLPSFQPAAPMKMNSQPQPADKYEHQPAQEPRGLTNVIRKKAVA